MSAAFDVAFDPLDVTQFRRVKKEMVGIRTSIWLFIAYFSVSVSSAVSRPVPTVLCSDEGLALKKKREKKKIPESSLKSKQQ